MIVLLVIVVLAVVSGLLMPLRWGLWGFLGCTALLFALQAGISTALGFDGTSVVESLLLFNNSWVAYIGFNLQITYRAFALPLLVLAALVIYRQKGAAQ
ncbi:hypothetical protein [uncultured Tateyamaria sp.]|uniref:hypothetical protein n=1 Tax=uncultured Tateyamaria sp. TaxID=455651 RepID=UPI00260FC610|nr:hypothetical protein [uncultured Tateyamaria sp.]